MAYTGTAYGDISPRTAADVVMDLLERSEPLLVIEKFGKTKPLPRNHTQSMKFRRYFLVHSEMGDDYAAGVYFGSSKFDPSSFELSEGVTPAATKLDSEDITVTLKQYGNRTELSDWIYDTHEDPVLQESVDILSEQAAVILEMVRFNKLVAGTNVIYANGDARNEVNEPLTLSLQRKATRQLKRNLGKPISRVLKSGPAYANYSVPPAYIGLVHIDMEPTVRGMAGFIPTEEYGSMDTYPGEIGKVENVRYCASTVFKAFEDAGGTYDSGSIEAISTSGSKADVYPVIILAQNAFAVTPLKGRSSISPTVVNPKPSDSDPLGQRGHVGWKAWHGLVILQEMWMTRIEVAIAEL